MPDKKPLHPRKEIKKTVSVRLPVGVIAKIQEQAFIERRSFSNQIELAVDGYYKKRKGVA